MSSYVLKNKIRRDIINNNHKIEYMIYPITLNNIVI